MKRDYYEILGIPKDATLQQIKKSYRSLALKHHPDRVSTDKKKESEEKFKEISEAYGVLSDSEKRKMYDQYGHAGIDQRYTADDIFRGADFGSFGDLGDIFSQFFGDSFDIFGSGSSRGTRQRRGRDIQYEVAISLEEAYKGIKKKISVPRNEHCTTCNGDGSKPGSKKKTCPTCQGRGQVAMSLGGFFQMNQPCSTCSGQGQMITEYCPKCKGRGAVKVTRKIDVTIPPGVDNDTQLRIRGEGEVGSGGPGDLYIYIHVQPHSVFGREGRHLKMDLPISFVIAAIGGEVSVPTIGGKVTMKIPPGTQGDKIFRLKGSGMPDLHGGIKGDQYVRITISVPSKLSLEQRKILEQFAQTNGDDVQKGDKSFAEKIKKVFK